MSNSYDKFKAEPVKYCLRKTGTFIADYWDLGAAMLAGFAFNDYQNEVLGVFRGAAMGAGFLGSCIGPAIEGFHYNNKEGQCHRFIRNTTGGFSTLFFFYPNGIENLTTIQYLCHKIIGGAVLAEGLLVNDRFYQQSKANRNCDLNKVHYPKPYTD